MCNSDKRRFSFRFYTPQFCAISHVHITLFTIARVTEKKIIAKSTPLPASSRTLFRFPERPLTQGLPRSLKKQKYTGRLGTQKTCIKNAE